MQYLYCKCGSKNEPEQIAISKAYDYYEPDEYEYTCPDCGNIRVG